MSVTHSDQRYRRGEHLEGWFHGRSWLEDKGLLLVSFFFSFSVCLVFLFPTCLFTILVVVFVFVSRGACPSSCLSGKALVSVSVTPFRRTGDCVCARMQAQCVA